MCRSIKTLRRPDEPATEDEIRAALHFNLCRCGTHIRILAAIRRAQGEMQQATAEAPRQG